MTARTGMKLVIGVAAVAVVAACSSGGGSGGTEGGEPQRGGTLNFVGSSDVTSLDTAFSYYTLNYVLSRGYTRQMVSYKSTNDPDKAGDIVADMATEVPTKGNGGISEDGKTYTFTIKKGVKWNTDPERQVTAEDFERGIKRLCNPAFPSGALSYYTTTIQGMKKFCDGFSKVKTDAKAIADYVTSNDISGIKPQGERKLSVSLINPTPDFLNIMAEYFATPAPKEYLQYVPNSREFNQNVLSNGPYMVTKYSPNKEIELERNPAWDADTDDIRPAYVDKIHVQEGVEQQSAYQQVYSGTADMMWADPPPTAKLPSLYNDDRLELTQDGTFNKYVVFNEVSPNENKATSNPKVREAIALAVDKDAIIQVYGGPKIAEPACQIMPSSSEAHIDDFECLYQTGDRDADLEKAKELLDEAGYGDGLTLKMIYRNEGNHVEVAQVLQQSLKDAGITLKTQPVPADDFYASYLQNPDTARRGVWDLTAPGWIPDWYGINGRTYLQPLFYSENISKDDSSWGTNYGFYNSDKVNKLIDTATTAETQEEAVSAFRDAQKQVVEDLGVVPVMWQKTPQLHSKSVHGFQGFPNSLGDITSLWVSE